MIDISHFADKIEELLNAEIETAISAGGRTSEILDNGKVTYEFRVYADGGEYRDFDYIDGQGAISREQTNKIVRYINCEFDTTGSRSDGVLSVEMSFNTRFQVMIPLVNTGRGAKKLELVNTIRQVIDNAFRLNTTSTMEDNGTTYTYGVLYQFADTGDRIKRAEIGDSIILTAFLSYFLVQDGVNSADFKLYLDEVDELHRVKFTRLGFNRGCTNESVIPSDSTNGAGKNVTTSTVFGLNFDMPLRNGYVDIRIERFLYLGDKTPRSVYVKTPLREEPIEYKMIFSDVSINAETTKFASVAVSMVEAL